MFFPAPILRSATHRAFVVCCAMVCVFTGFSYRLVHLQVFMHEAYTDLAAEKHGGRQTIYARRGMIQDSSGWPLAQNEPVKTVIADGSLIRDHAQLAALLSGPLKMPEAELLKLLGRARWNEGAGLNEPLRYIVLKKEVAECDASEISRALVENKIKMGAITFEQDSVRVYPNGEMGCHLIGFTNHTGFGVEGVERSMNDYLRGHDGFRYTEHDRTGREMVPYRGAERPPRHGCNVRLTVDSQIQMIVEGELEAAVKEYKPYFATALVLRPQTGEVLAMANYPHFNLNQQAEVKPFARINHAIMSTVEPGSTFKIVPVTAALTQKLVQPDTVIFCENGKFLHGGKILHDHGKGYGDLTVNGILAHSSNIGVAKLAIQMGDQKLYDYARRFGFGDNTGIALPGEVRGIVRPLHVWDKLSITHVPMGQEVTATPLQIASAMATVANGGHLMVPQIVREITDSEGNPVVTFAPQEVRQVIPSAVCEEVREALMEVVSTKGTAALAAVRGFNVAGKTGTAQISNGKGLVANRYVCSFVGFMPAEKPEFVCLVLLHSPVVGHDKNYGGQTAAPVFSRIATRTAAVLGLTPSPELMAASAAAQTGPAIRD